VSTVGTSNQADTRVTVRSPRDQVSEPLARTHTTAATSPKAVPAAAYTAAVETIRRRARRHAVPSSSTWWRAPAASRTTTGEEGATPSTGTGAGTPPSGALPGAVARMERPTARR
jgi:hypothetical protein